MATYAPPTRTPETKAADRPRPRPATAPRPPWLGAAQLEAIHRTLNGGPIQRRAAPAKTAGGMIGGIAKGVANAFQPAPKATNRTGLPDRLKAGLEAQSGLAMDDVRVHRNSPEPARLGALAYAQGTDIHLGPGQEQHLPHEAWHVVQQKQGRVRATMQMKGLAINNDGSLEAEADRVAERIRSHLPNELGPASRQGDALGSPVKERKARGSKVAQLQHGSKSHTEPLIKSISTPQDNVRTDFINKKIAEATAKQLHAQLEAEKNVPPEMKKFVQNRNMSPELYKWAKIEMKNKKTVAAISQGRELTASEKEYSDLWRLEYETRNKYCTEFEKSQLEANGGFKNQYVKDRLYVIENSGAALWLNPESPISVWKFLDMFARLLGRGPSVPGHVKMGMKSQMDKLPFTPHTTLIDPSAGLRSANPTKLGSRDR